MLEVLWMPLTALVVGLTVYVHNTVKAEERLIAIEKTINSIEERERLRRNK